MEEKKKSNVGLIILVVILLLACICMGGFIFLNKDKIFTKDNTQTTENNKQAKEEDTNKNLEVDDTLVKSLYSMTRSEYDKCDYPKQPLLLENVGDKLTLSNMEDDYKGVIVYDYVTKNKEISEENMKEAFEKVFGPNTYKVMNTIYFAALGKINYDANSKKYTLTFDPNEPWGCVTHLYNKEKIINALQKGDTIQITTAYVFNGSFEAGLYKDSKGKEPLGVSMLINEDENKTLSFIEEHKDELHQLSYTFKKYSDGNYYYLSVERTK